MIKINSFYSQQELYRYYNFVLKKKPSIVKTNGKGTAMISLLNQLPQKKSPQIKIGSFYELLTMNFSDLQKFCDSLATDKPRYKNLLKQSKEDLRIYKSYYSEFFHKIDETIGIRNNMILIKNLDITVCPYCNRNYINSRHDKLGCEFDHYYSKDKFPFFALTLSNLVPSCSTCNRIKQANDYEFCPFDLEEDIEVKFVVSPPSKDSKIKILFGEKSQEDNILKLEDAYEIHKKDVAEMFMKEEKYCKEYRDYLISLLGDKGNIVNEFSEEFFDSMIFGEIANDSFDDYLNHSLSKLKKDTYDYIVELREK